MAGKQLFSQAWTDIVDFIVSHTPTGYTPLLLAHNALFDLRMLKQELTRPMTSTFKEQQWYFGCTLALFKKVWPNRSAYRLTSLATDFELDHDAHRALGDVEVTDQLLSFACDEMGIDFVLEEIREQMTLHTLNILSDAADDEGIALQDNSRRSASAIASAQRKHVPTAAPSAGRNPSARSMHTKASNASSETDTNDQHAHPGDGAVFGTEKGACYHVDRKCKRLEQAKSEIKQWNTIQSGKTLCKTCGKLPVTCSTITSDTATNTRLSTHNTTAETTTPRQAQVTSSTATTTRQAAPSIPKSSTSISPANTSNTGDISQLFGTSQGSRYHIDRACKGLEKATSEIKQWTAIPKGKTPCKVCILKSVQLH